MWERLRTQDLEILDTEGASPRAIRILEDLERFNQRVGWTRAHLRAARLHWIALGRPEPFRILDVGSGIGGMIASLLVWGEREGIDVEVSGVDHNPSFVDIARERLGGRADLFEADARALGCGDRTFHLTTCALMMHHLPPPSRSALVAELGRVSHSQYVFDLQFTLYGVLGAPIVSRLGGLGPDATSDGITSVRRACTFAEFETLVAPLAVRPVRMIPTAMATFPEGYRRIRLPWDGGIRIPRSAVALRGVAQSSEESCAN